ncbi:hypothetical protein VTK73DRAFT_1165 [Phialemonium thermophilum]|uniref:Uncharacterized protein n=1 Tax=Phialemonium thermophilum TaxID=223376 RepID=A0ABR3XAW4_9PEZI
MCPSHTPQPSNVPKPAMQVGTLYLPTLPLNYLKCPITLQSCDINPYPRITCTPIPQQLYAYFLLSAPVNVTGQLSECGENQGKPEGKKKYPTPSHPTPVSLRRMTFSSQRTLRGQSPLH